MKVLFVCDYGSKKSLMAAEYFNQLAKTRGLNASATSRGITPDAEVPPRVRAALMTDGIDIGAAQPRAFQAEDASSPIIVSFSPEFAAEHADHTGMHSWADVPALSDDFDVAQSEIKKRVNELVQDLALRQTDES